MHEDTSLPLQNHLTSGKLAPTFVASRKETPITVIKSFVELGLLEGKLFPAVVNPVPVGA